MSAGVKPTIGSLVEGRYQILQELQGSNGALSFKAHDNASADPSADKVILKFSSVRSASDEALRKKAAEAKSSRSLCHKNLVASFELREDPQLGHFIVRKYVSGKNLSELIKERHSLNQNEFLDIIQQATQALAFLHGKKLVHQNLCSNNVIINSEYGVKIIDVFAATEPGLSAREAADTRADIYALGSLMYEGAGGVAPFSGERGTIKRSAGRSAQTPPPFEALIPSKKVDPQIETVIFRCLEPDPEQRYQQIASVLHDLKRIEEGAEIQPLSLKKSRVGSKLVVGGIVALTILAGLGTSAFLLPKQQANRPQQVVQDPAAAAEAQRVMAARQQEQAMANQEARADGLYASGKYTEAAESYGQLVNLLAGQYGNESAQNVRVLHKMAKAELWNQFTGQSTNAYAMLGEIFRRRPDLAPKGTDLQREIYELAQQMFKQGKVNAAEDAYNLAFMMGRRFQPSEKAFSYHILVLDGKCEGLEHDFTNSIKSFDKALATLRTDSDINKEDLDLVLVEYAKLLIERSGLEKAGSEKKADRSKASRFLAEALPLRQARGDKAGTQEISSLLAKLAAN